MCVKQNVAFITEVLRYKLRMKVVIFFCLKKSSTNFAEKDYRLMEVLCKVNDLSGKLFSSYSKTMLQNWAVGKNIMHVHITTFAETILRGILS